jgi:NAD(P)-dependent dehydrogenase (short-subunit alcohol dehydrogenase family)
MGKKRVVLITGASSGLGLAMANDLYLAGYRVYGTSRLADGKSNPHGSFELIQMDVADDASVAAGVERVIGREGDLDAVICNAGFGMAGSIEDTSSAEAIAQFQVNFFGVHRVCRSALPHLRRQDPSHLVIIGSLAGLVGLPFQGFYSATKHALEGYAESLRIELRGTSVRVTIVEPGDFATGFTASRQVVAAADEGSQYQAAFNIALERIAAMETIEGADPQLLGQCVASILDADQPPLRAPVGAREQVELINDRHKIPPEDLEDMLAGAFGLK